MEHHDTTERLSKRVEQLSRLMDVTKSIAAQLDLEPLLQQIVDSATRLLNASMGGLLVLKEGDSSVEFFKVSGIAFRGAVTPCTSGLLGYSIRERCTLRLDDVRQHFLMRALPESHPAVGPFLSAPLLAKGMALGVLLMGNPPGGATFGPDAEELLVAFAAQATVAIENARLYAKMEQLARVRERDRIAHALHDSLAQMLFSIGLESRWCMSNGPDRPDYQTHMQSIRDLSVRSSEELRSAIFALYSPYLPRGGELLPLLETRLREFEVQTGIAARLVAVPSFPPLPALVGEAVFRIVVESLSNVRKHAKATGVIVSLDHQTDSVVVTIQDNGVGLGAQSLNPADDRFRFGVQAMRDAAVSAEGALSISNNDDSGVMIKARFPLPRGTHA